MRQQSHHLRIGNYAYYTETWINDVPINEVFSMSATSGGRG